MGRLRLFIALSTVLASALVPAAPVLASGVSSIYKECQDSPTGKLTGHYTRAELQAALNPMSSEVAEYSECSDLIDQALLRVSSQSGNRSTSHGTLAGSHTGGVPGGRGGKGPSDGPGGKSRSPATRNDIAPIGAGDLAGASIRPDPTSTGSSLPAALIVVLVLFALTGMSGAAVAIRRRVVSRHGT